MRICLFACDSICVFRFLENRYHNISISLPLVPSVCEKSRPEDRVSWFSEAGNLFRVFQPIGWSMGAPPWQTTVVICIYIYMCQGLNSHYFHILGDGHQPNSRGLYTHYKDSY